MLAAAISTLRVAMLALPILCTFLIQCSPLALSCSKFRLAWSSAMKRFLAPSLLTLATPQVSMGRGLAWEATKNEYKQPEISCLRSNPSITKLNTTWVL